jgi:hypothetical protein
MHISLILHFTLLRFLALAIFLVALASAIFLSAASGTSNMTPLLIVALITDYCVCPIVGFNIRIRKETGEIQ